MKFVTIKRVQGVVENNLVKEKRNSLLEFTPKAKTTTTK